MHLGGKCKIAWSINESIRSQGAMADRVKGKLFTANNKLLTDPF